MYFKSFPYTFYSLDDISTVQVVTNITARVILSDEVKTNLGLFDEYDIKDGETPELVADKFYNNPELHWIVLHYNEIIDPRFDWPLSTNNLNLYVASKYTDVNGIHHYEDANLNYINGNVILTSNNSFGNFALNDPITNNTNIGSGVITSKISNSNVFITVPSMQQLNIPYILTPSKIDLNTILIKVFLYDGTFASTPNLTDIPIEIRIY